MKLTAKNVVACLQAFPQGLSAKELLKALGQSQAKKNQLRGILRGLSGGRLIVKEKDRYQLTGKPLKEKKRPRQREGDLKGQAAQLDQRGVLFWQGDTPMLWPLGKLEPFAVSKKQAGLSDLIPGDEVRFEPKVRGGAYNLKPLSRKLEAVQAKLFCQREQMWGQPLCSGLPALALSGLPFDPHLEGRFALISALDLPQKAKVLRVLPHNPSYEELYQDIFTDFGLTLPFPAEALKEAASYPERAPLEEGRKDLRHLDLVTIDGEDAKDYDDAIFVSPEGENYRLFVAIADVAHFVRPGTPLDQEAQRRSTSVYLPGYVIPMLPEALSNGLCSLQAGKDRLSLTCEMLIDPQGSALEFQVYEAVIQVRQRLTYDQLDHFFQGKETQGLAPSLPEMLTQAGQLAQILQKKRAQRGAIQFSLPDSRFFFTPEGQIQTVVKTRQTVSQKLIEQFMLEANESVGKLVDQEGLSILWRNHPDPLPEKMRALREMLHNEGVRLAHLKSGKDYNEVLKRVLGSHKQEYIEYHLLRSLSLALYESQRLHHFGLAASHYLHFTSPIRRYPDLVVHRAFKAWLKGQKPWKTPYWLGQQASDRERNAQKAERDANRLQKMILMADRIGEVFTGKLSGLHQAGIWIELSDPFVEGFIPYAAIPDDHYHFEERQFKAYGRSTKRVLAVGQAVQVLLNGLDPRNRSLNFLWLTWK